MLLNHARQTPRDWDDAVASLCPDCGAGLIPRRGRVTVWHWAHRAASHGAGGGGGCSATESAWHLGWKSVYRSFPGWDVEVPFVTAGSTFRLDAAALARGQAREFVHSLSDKYVAKHLALRRCGLRLSWIFDGSGFAAERRRSVKGGGYKHLLKPKARWLHHQIGGYVHHDRLLWREWRHDVWYPVEGQRAAEVLSRFEQHGTCA